MNLSKKNVCAKIKPISTPSPSESDNLVNNVVELVKKYINYNEPGSCGPFALWTTRILLKSNFKDFKIVFGYVHSTKGIHEHIWIELNTEKIIDPTIAQFPTAICYDYVKLYLEPEEFLNRKGFRLDDPRTGPWIKRYLKNV